MNLLTISIGIIIFILIRELVTWYWKMNETVELLKKIEENTRPKEVDNKNSDA